jgi:hypothetical protein
LVASSSLSTKLSVTNTLSLMSKDTSKVDIHPQRAKPMISGVRFCYLDNRKKTMVT